MDLTRIQKRELMWLASVAKADGTISPEDLDTRRKALENITYDDFKHRYEALKGFCYVDQLNHGWKTPVITVRLTEEGRERAEEFLEEEMASSLISDETKKTVKDTLLSQGIGAAFKVFLIGIGFIA